MWIINSFCLYSAAGTIFIGAMIGGLFGIALLGQDKVFINDVIAGEFVGCLWFLSLLDGSEGLSFDVGLHRCINANIIFYDKFYKVLLSGIILKSLQFLNSKHSLISHSSH